MYYKIASLILNSEQKSASASDIFIAQPDVHKEMLVGKLFVLAEIESQKGEAVKILDFIINNLNFNYYQNEKVILKERIETISLESIFESSLAKTNKDLVEFLTREKIKISPYAFNLTACVLHNNELYFSTVGKNKNLLIYKEKTSLKPPRGKNGPELEKIEYKITDIGYDREKESEAVTLNKLFSEVTSGKIPLGGHFLVINEALSEYLSPKQLVRIVTKLSPSGAVEQIRNLLAQINSYVSFLGIIVKNTVTANLSGEELKQKIENEIKNWDYKPEIVSTEEKTEAIMTPAGIINFKRWFKILAEKMKKKNPAATLPPDGAAPKPKRGFFLKDKVFFKKRASWLSLDKAADFFRKVGKLLLAALSSIKKLPAKPAPAAGAAEAAPPTFNRRRAKFILIAALVLIAALAVNLAVTGQKNKREEKLRTFNNLLATIEKNQNKIEANLLYDNEAEAQRILNENAELLKSIPSEEAAKREMIRGLFQKQAEQTEKTRRIIRVTELKKIAIFSTLNSAANPQNLILSAAKLYAADAAARAIYKIDLKENIVTATYDLPQTDWLKWPTAAANGSLYYFAGQKILELDKNGQAALLDIKLPTDAANIAGFQSYNDKLYLLDKREGQIYRYGRTAAGFGSGAGWLNEKIDLNGASDLFIDGNLYLLFQDGRVEKYLKGQKEDFPSLAIEEPLKGASHLILGEKNIFIFEPAGKRLAVFDLKGKLSAQYIFEKFDAAMDFSVDEAAGKIYLLAGAEVYEMDFKN